MKWNRKPADQTERPTTTTTPKLHLSRAKLRDLEADPATADKIKGGFTSCIGGCRTTCGCP